MKVTVLTCPETEKAGSHDVVVNQVVKAHRCYREQASELATAAAAAGLDYPAVVNQVADPAVERYEQGI